MTLALAAVAWVVAVDRMNGMDMGVATELGSFPVFMAAWVSMMAAMMLPGAVPSVARRPRDHDPALAVPLFLGSYLAIWTLGGLAVYALYGPHGTASAGALTIVPLALAIVALGTLALLAPSAVPGLTQPM